MKISTPYLIIALLIGNIMLFIQMRKAKILSSGSPIDITPAKKCALSMTVKSIETDMKLIKYISHRNGITIPALQMRTMFSKLLPCLSTSKTNLNVEVNSTASGWVLPNYKKNTMWLSAKWWDKLDIIEQAHTIIHECSHLTLNTYDYPYIHDEKYIHLRGKNATSNADTLTSIIIELNNYIC